MIKQGDKVVLLDPRGKRYLITIKEGEFHTDLGKINLNELLGKEFGTIVESHKDRKSVV